MAIKPCRECGKEVSTEAQSCPHCGCAQPVKKSISALGWVAVIAVGLIAYSCTQRAENRQSPASQASSQPASTTLSDAPPPARQAWVYRTSTDKMDGSVSNIAFLRSTNTLSFDFPYNDRDNRGKLIIRKNKKTGLNIMLGVDKGQFLCSVYDCQVRVKFDDEAPVDWKASETADRSSDMVFLMNESAFLNKLKKAKLVRIQPNFFRVSGVVLEFNTEGLVWP